VLLAAVSLFVAAHLLLLFEILRFEGYPKGFATIRWQMGFPVGWFLALMDVLFAVAAAMSFHPRVSRLFVFLVESFTLAQLGAFVLALQYLETFPGSQPDIRVSTDLWVISFAVLFVGSMLPRAAGSIMRSTSESGVKLIPQRSTVLSGLMPSPDRPMRVLVCEGERHIGGLIELNLVRSGYTVTSVFDGSAAIGALERADGVQDPRIDIVLVEEEFPGLSGVSLLDWVRTHEHTKGVRVGIRAERLGWWNRENGEDTVAGGQPITWYEPLDLGE